MSKPEWVEKWSEEFEARSLGARVARMNDFTAGGAVIDDAMRAELNALAKADEEGDE